MLIRIGISALPGADYKPAVTATEVKDKYALKKLVEKASKAYESFFGEGEKYSAQKRVLVFSVTCKIDVRGTYARTSVC